MRPVEVAAGGVGTVGLAASPPFSGVLHVTCKRHSRTLSGYQRLPLSEHPDRSHEADAQEDVLEGLCT